MLEGGHKQEKLNSSSTRKQRSKSSNNPHMSDVKCFIENRTQNASTRNGAQVSSSMMPGMTGQPGQPVALYTGKPEWNSIRPTLQKIQ